MSEKIYRVQMNSKGMPNFSTAVEVADRPQGEWIFHYRDKWMVKAECPKCHRRFEFSPRTIWKCCPMCETRMKGVSNEADRDNNNRPHRLTGLRTTDSV